MGLQEHPTMEEHEYKMEQGEYVTEVRSKSRGMMSMINIWGKVMN